MSLPSALTRTMWNSTPAARFCDWLRLAALGYTTGIVDLTRGEAGTRGTVDQRAAESRAAATVLGLSFRETLDLGDSKLDDSEAGRESVVAILRRMRPLLVLTHYADQPHPDHAAAAAIVKAAVYLADLQKTFCGERPAAASPQLCSALRPSARHSAELYRECLGFR